MIRKINLTIEEAYEKLKNRYENWHYPCSACEGNGDFSFACNRGNYFYECSYPQKGIVVYYYSGSGKEENENVYEFTLKDGILIVKEDPRNYVAPWYSVESVLETLGVKLRKKQEKKEKKKVKRQL